MKTPRCDKCDGTLHEDGCIVRGEKKFCSLGCLQDYDFRRYATETELEHAPSFQGQMLRRRLKMFLKGV
jgi:hypothetical protein